MNANTPIDSGMDPSAWDEAAQGVNAWRGQALQCFAQAEAAVSETLLVLGSARHEGARVRLRRLVGQRFEDLRSAVGPDGPFVQKGQKAAAALAAFHPHETLRPFLCHGIAKVTLDRHGQWLVVLKVLAFRGREAERSSLTYEKREAETVLADLKGVSHQLVSALQSLRDRISD